MHTHFGALVIASAFVGTLLAGTLWRLISFHLANSTSPTAIAIAQAMAVQY